LPEFTGLGSQVGVTQYADLGLAPVDFIHQGYDLFDIPFVLGPKYLLEQSTYHDGWFVPPFKGVSVVQAMPASPSKALTAAMGTSPSDHPIGKILEHNFIHITRLPRFCNSCKSLGFTGVKLLRG
jgi:hypothetical protein